MILEERKRKIVTEKWSKIPNFPQYEISNLGHIVKIGKTKRIPIAVKQDKNYVSASLTYAPHKTKQVNVKRILDSCFTEHIYSDSALCNQEGEIWKDVVGWENSYSVSNFGRIKSKARTRAGKNGTESIISEKIKKTYTDEDGYERVSLYEDNKTKLLGVHRIVAEAFLPNPDNLPQVNHLNSNKTDNRAENLEWR